MRAPQEALQILYKAIDPDPSGPSSSDTSDKPEETKASQPNGFPTVEQALRRKMEEINEFRDLGWEIANRLSSSDKKP